MGSSKKHKKHKIHRRGKYEEYSNNRDPACFQKCFKLNLKSSANKTFLSEAKSNNAKECASPKANIANATITTKAAVDVSPLVLKHLEQCSTGKRMKSKNKRKHEKIHKHRKERKKFRSARMEVTEDVSQESQLGGPRVAKFGPAFGVPVTADTDSSQDSISFADDDDSQPLPENVLFYAGMTTDNSPSCRPVSKPIVPRKCDDLLLKSPSTTSFYNSYVELACQTGDTDCTRATKSLSDIVAHSPSPTASNPSGLGSSATLTPKTLDSSKTANITSDSGREPRSCVLKLKQQKSPLNKLLEHLLRVLEKRDPHQFFAWPVTDDIAPGYSRIITKPIDFSTIRQKIEDNEYSTLTEFSSDFRLMCDNAIKYNHVDTVYHKAAKRLLQVGLKHLAAESLMRSLKPLSGYMRELTAKELGFELIHEAGEGNAFEGYEQQHMIDSADEGASTGAEETFTQADEDDKRREYHSKFGLDSLVHELSSEENLAQVTAEPVKKRLTVKERANKLGFLRLNRDGSTSLNFLIKDENEGPEKVVDLENLLGKLEQGSGQVHCYREDKRNEAKLIKPLQYGSYASFAPTYDSRFSNLNKQHTQLIMQTYGDDSENIEILENNLQDASYATMLANGLLSNVFTDAEDNQYKENVQDLQMDMCKQEEEEEEEEEDASNNPNNGRVNSKARAQIEQEYEKYKNTRIDFNRLRTLNELGIDVGFLEDVEKEMKNIELTRRLEEHLSNNFNLIDKLRLAQHERLSQPLPQHLALIPQPSIEETQLAHQITQQLTDVAKKLPPSAITDMYSLRKAMGVSFVGLPPLKPSHPSSSFPSILQDPITLPKLNFSPLTTLNAAQQSVDSNASNTLQSMDIDENGSTMAATNLQNELHDFLENVHAVSTVANDNTLVA